MPNDSGKFIKLVGQSVSTTVPRSADLCGLPRHLNERGSTISAFALVQWRPLCCVVLRCDGDPAPSLGETLNSIKRGVAGGSLVAIAFVTPRTHYEPSKCPRTEGNDKRNEDAHEPL